MRSGGRKNVATVALSVLVDSEIETGKLEMQDWLKARTFILYQSIATAM